jgi:hypothetical protein
VFYVLIFSVLAVVLVVGGITSMARRRKTLEREEAHMASHSQAGRRTQKAKRAQSQHDRRRRR